MSQIEESITPEGERVQRTLTVLQAALYFTENPEAATNYVMGHCKAADIARWLEVYDTPLMQALMRDACYTPDRTARLLLMALTHLPLSNISSAAWQVAIRHYPHQLVSHMHTYFNCIIDLNAFRDNVANFICHSTHNFLYLLAADVNLQRTRNRNNEQLYRELIIEHQITGGAREQLLRRYDPVDFSKEPELVRH